MAFASAEIVIVGGGMAGGALATVLARAGIVVLVLERTTTYPDCVRGEYFPPWGVAELKRLGLYELFTRNGGLTITHIVPYSDLFEPEEAEARSLDVTKMHPDAPGPLCLGHPAMCNLLIEAAVDSGATVLRGITDIEVVSGSTPRVSFMHEGHVREICPRLVIGADGRNSQVRKQLGVQLQSDEPHNLIGGILVGNMPSWPRHIQCVGVEDRLHFLIFPQNEDKVRLYACYDFADRSRFSGPDREKKALEAFKLKCAPLTEQLVDATILGPFNSVSNEDTWIDNPVCPGVVLIGDAAGYNDPIIGQGLSIAARDVRLVSEIILDAKSAAKGLDFAPYIEERMERMRRLRISARLAAKIRVEFGPEARERRILTARRAAERQLSPLPASLMGPERLPAEAFLPETIQRFIAP